MHYNEALGDYVNIHTATERLTIYTTVKDIGSKLEELKMANYSAQALCMGSRNEIREARAEAAARKNPLTSITSKHWATP